MAKTQELNAGYIQLHRRIREHWLWEDGNKLKWWLDILMECNHEDRKVSIGFELIPCKRGQSLNSLLTWAKRWRVDKSTVRRFFTMLQSDGMIVTENVQKTTRLTVCNYDTYNLSRHTKQLVNNSDATLTQHKQELNNNVSNNEKNKEEELSVIHPFGDLFKAEWQRWKEYKKTQHRFTYKSLDSEQAAVNDLVRLSNSDEITATKIIIQSIGKGWKGFFELKNNTNGTNRQSPAGTVIKLGTSEARLQAARDY